MQVEVPMGVGEAATKAPHDCEWLVFQAASGPDPAQGGGHQSRPADLVDLPC
jgi:hypothetical protein